jgi:hypothetical protein
VTRYIGIDTETHRFGVGNQAPKVVCLSWATDGERGLVTDDGEVEWADGVPTQRQGRGIKAAFRALADTLDVHVVGHNIAYDMMCLVATYPDLWPSMLQLYDENRVHCTWII